MSLSPSLSSLTLAALAPEGFTPDVAAEAVWLAGHRERIGGAANDWKGAFREWCTAPPAEDRRLAALSAAMRLSTAETLAVSLAGACESDAMTGRALAWLQAPIGGARPIAGLVANLAHRFGDASALASLAAGPARASGLLQLESDHRSFPEASMAVPQPIVLALRDPPRLFWPGLELGLHDPPVLPPTVREAAAVRARALTRGAASGLVVQSGHPREAKAVAAEIAARLGAVAVFLDGDAPSGLGPWLSLARAVPVVCVELAPGERRQVKPVAGWNGPVLVASGPDGSFDRDGEPLPVWRVPVPSADERTALWQAATGNAGLAAVLGPAHRHAAERIGNLARAGRFQAELTGVDRVGPAEIAQAARAGTGGDLGPLVELLSDPIPDEALVLSATTHRELVALAARCVARDALADGLGPASRARYRPGVRALLVGPSGTGKTLAAGWLATRLGVPLYRVDLAAVTSKYIGETEKNLAQLFARAEHAEVVLLFDEADSLFGKRTDVKDSNDRFANAQTNYLLARIESYEGIAILTSNSRSRFDSAFTRRLDAIIEFPAPGPDERRALWLAHLGTAHALGASELNRLAATCELAGGHIRNIVLAAAVSARSQARPIAETDLRRAIAAEYRKLGRPLPAVLGLENDPARETR